MIPALGSCRQQIEDCELEMRRLKGILEKKEENEKKYQGVWEHRSLGQSCTQYCPACVLVASGLP